MWASSSLPLTMKLNWIDLTNVAMFCFCIYKTIYTEIDGEPIEIIVKA